MKMVIAVIQPTKLNAVRDALLRAGVDRMTVCDALGYGRQRGQSQMYRGREYKLDMLRKVELEIIVNEDFLDRTIEAITKLEQLAGCARCPYLDHADEILFDDFFHRYLSPVVGKRAVICNYTARRPRSHGRALARSA